MMKRTEGGGSSLMRLNRKKVRAKRCCDDSDVG